MADAPVQINFETIRGILEHRLHQADIERLLHGLSETEKTQLFLRITELVRRTSALVDISNRVSDTLSLDVLFPRLMEVVTETLNVERSSLFLHDPDSKELFSRVMQGNSMGEVRFPASLGIAGSVFTRGEGEIIHDAYADARFNRDFDAKTGYRTRNILCVPIRNKKREVIGVTQALNKKEGGFDLEDQRLLEALSSQAAAALENARMFERVERAQREETVFLDVVSLIASEIHLDPLLEKILAAAAQLLNADRGALFLYDPVTNELYSRIAGGAEKEIRFPAIAGIAGECFTRGVPVTIDDAYHDPRFNPEVDRGTGYRTRNILCMPVTTKGGHKVGVMEILNKREGSFTAADQKRLAALCAQAAVSIENAQLFEDVNNAHGYNESILRSMSNGVVTFDAANLANKVNDSALRILRLRSDVQVINKTPGEIFGERNKWILQSLEKVRGTGKTDVTVDTDLLLDGHEAVSLNLTAVPLRSMRDQPLGSMLIMEDVTREKRLRNTMSRYMSKAVMDQLLEKGDAVLGGTGREVSVLFSDIRGFTALTERLGARQTVAMLNEYFTDMVDVVFAHNGILDKYIGDMIMAVFGSVLTSDEDADNAVTVGSRMMVTLRELNARRTIAGQDPIRIGVGISTGHVVAGNIGSPRRLEFTVIGDRVNLAERLQNANKYYGTSVLICDRTAARLKRAVKMRELDLIRVRGMSNPVPIYEVLDHHTEESFPNLDVVVSAFRRGIALYRRQSWAKASDCFAEALTAYPGDRPSRLYMERCETYRTESPPPAWDGAWDVRTT